MGAMARTDRVLRPFWLHQSAEYLIGLVLVAMGLQAIEPAVPTIAGGVVLLNAALVDGPLGAFRLFSRRAHRVVDVVVIAALGLAAVLPFLDLDATSRVLLGGAAAVLGVVWWNSAFEARRPRRSDRRADRPRRPPAGPPAGPAPSPPTAARRSAAAPGASPAASPRPCATARSRTERRPVSRIRPDRAGSPGQKRRASPPVASSPWRSNVRPRTSRS